MTNHQYHTVEQTEQTEQAGHSGHALPKATAENARALKITGWFTGIYFFIELAIGIWTGSVAVMSARVSHFFSRRRGADRARGGTFRDSSGYAIPDFRLDPGRDHRRALQWPIPAGYGHLCLLDGLHATAESD